MSSSRLGWRAAAALAALLLTWIAPAAAQDLTWETTIDFAFNQKVSLEGAVGPVEIRGVEFVQPTGKGGLGKAIKGTFTSGDDDLKGTVITRLELATTSATKWKAEFMIEFLDADGELIDRARGNASLKSEAKLVEVSHTTLKWVLTKVVKVRIASQGSGKM